MGVRMGVRMLVWWKPEFDDCKSAEKRGDLAWPVPPDRGIFDPTRIIHCDDVEDAARKYADYFHSDRDGYECEWPQDFVVFDNETGKFYTVNVEREFCPEFHSADPVELVLDTQPKQEA